MARKTSIAGFKPKRQHRVAVVAYDGVVPFDLATPCEVFGWTRLKDGSAPYVVSVCGCAREVDAGLFRLRTKSGLGPLSTAETIILPGVDDIDRPVPAALVRALRNAAKRGAQIASICSGAFVFASTGLLDGQRATTHWRAAAELARRFPAIVVDADVLYVDGGQFLTAAGASAGLDLCLHLVRRDFGAAVAADAARAAVMPLERAGGQAQFIVHTPPSHDGSSLQPVLAWIDANLQRDVGLQAIARRAAMSVRTLSRRFAEQTGTTPLQWVTHARVRRAQTLLETTKRSVERIADDVGFGSSSTLRANFLAIVGLSPLAYRRTFR